jgi:hypothetical protein
MVRRRKYFNLLYTAIRPPWVDASPSNAIAAAYAPCRDMNAPALRGKPSWTRAAKRHDAKNVGGTQQAQLAV